MFFIVSLVRAFSDKECVPNSTPFCGWVFFFFFFFPSHSHQFHTLSETVKEHSKFGAILLSGSEILTCDDVMQKKKINLMSSYSCCAEYTKSRGQSTSQPGPVLPSPRIHLSTKAAVLTPCFETLYLDVTVHCQSVWLNLRKKKKKNVRSRCVVTVPKTLRLSVCVAHTQICAPAHARLFLQECGRASCFSPCHSPTEGVARQTAQIWSAQH